MLVGGILLLILGFYMIFRNRYSLKRSDGGMQVQKKDEVKKDGYYKYTLFIGIFAVVLGMFSILSYIIY